ncbi:hypothetical protein GCM10027578_12920 [Spirosoma luteolum]
MHHTLIIETQAEADYQLLLGLAYRLGLRVRESNEPTADSPKRDTDATVPSTRPVGTLKGSFRLAPDFDEPLDDLTEYM